MKKKNQNLPYQEIIQKTKKNHQNYEQISFNTTQEEQHRNDQNQYVQDLTNYTTFNVNKNNVLNGETKNKQKINNQKKEIMVYDCQYLIQSPDQSLQNNIKNKTIRKKSQNDQSELKERILKLQNEIKNQKQKSLQLQKRNKQLMNMLVSASQSNVQRNQNFIHQVQRKIYNFIAGKELNKNMKSITKSHKSMKKQNQKMYTQSTIYKIQNTKLQKQKSVKKLFQTQQDDPLTARLKNRSNLNSYYSSTYTSNLSNQNFNSTNNLGISRSDFSSSINTKSQRLLNNQQLSVFNNLNLSRNTTNKNKNNYLDQSQTKYMKQKRLQDENFRKTTSKNHFYQNNKPKQKQMKIFNIIENKFMRV